MLFATCFWAKNALCHEFKMLSQVVEAAYPLSHTPYKMN